MIGFVIPLRPRSSSNDWSGTLNLLRRTLASVLASEDGELQVFVVSHDLDRLDAADDPRVNWIRVDFEVPPGDEQQRRRRDRNWKVAHGCVAATEQGVDWIYILDADDLVSRRLTRVLHAAKDYDAAVVNHGYEVHAGRWRAYPRRDLSHISGSTFAFRSQHIFGEGERTFLNCIALSQNHKTFDHYLRERQLRLKELEEPLIAYVRFHGQNLSDSLRSSSLRDRVRQWLKFAVLARPFKGELAAEFAFAPAER